MSETVSAFPAEPGSAPADVSPNAPGAKAESVPSELSPAAQTALEKYKLKVNGAEVEATLDDLKRGYSLGQGAHQKFQQAAEMMKRAEAMMSQVQSFQEMIQNNPEMIIKQADKGKFRNAAEKFLAEELRSEMMSPEERQAYAEQKAKDDKLSEYEKRDKEAKENAEKQRFNALLEQERTAYETKFIDAFKQMNWPADASQESKLLFMRDMATLLEAAVTAGYEPDSKELAAMATNSWLKQASLFYGAVPDESLDAVLPPDLAKRIRKRDLAKIRGAGVQAASPQSNGSAEPRQSSTKKLSPQEWKEQLWRKAGLDA